MDRARARSTYTLRGYRYFSIFATTAAHCLTIQRMPDDRKVSSKGVPVLSSSLRIAAAAPSGRTLLPFTRASYLAPVVGFARMYISG